MLCLYEFANFKAHMIAIYLNIFNVNGPSWTSWDKVSMDRMDLAGVAFFLLTVTKLKLKLQCSNDQFSRSAQITLGLDFRF